MRPFSNGSEYVWWRGENCHHCAKFNPEKHDGQCEIDGALGAAYIGSGHVSEEIARRLGAGEPGEYRFVPAACPEKEEMVP